MIQEVAMAYSNKNKVSTRIVLVLVSLVILSGSKCSESEIDLCELHLPLGTIEVTCPEGTPVGTVTEDIAPQIDNRSISRFDSEEYLPVSSHIDDVDGVWLMFTEEENANGTLYERYNCKISSLENMSGYYTSDCSFLQQYMNNPLYPGFVSLQLNNGVLSAAHVIEETGRDRNKVTYDIHYTLYIEATVTESGRIAGRIYSSNRWLSNYRFDEGVLPDRAYEDHSSGPTLKNIDFQMVRLSDDYQSLGTLRYRNREEAKLDSNLEYTEINTVYRFYESEQNFTKADYPRTGFFEWRVELFNESNDKFLNSSGSRYPAETPRYWNLFPAMSTDGSGNNISVTLDRHFDYLQNDHQKMTIHFDAFNSETRILEEMKEGLIELSF